MPAGMTRWPDMLFMLSSVRPTDYPGAGRACGHCCWVFGSVRAGVPAPCVEACCALSCIAGVIGTPYWSHPQTRVCTAMAAASVAAGSTYRLPCLQGSNPGAARYLTAFFMDHNGFPAVPMYHALWVMMTVP